VVVVVGIVVVVVGIVVVVVGIVVVVVVGIVCVTGNCRPAIRRLPVRATVVG